MRTKKLFALFLVLLFSGGCSQYEVGGEGTSSLDDALAMARNRCPGDIYDCYSYWSDLDKLWEHAKGNEKEVIEREMLTFLLKRLEDYGDPERTSVTLRALGEKTTSDDIKKAATEALLKYEQAQEAEAKQKEDMQVQEQKQAEDIRLAFRESRERLPRIGAGRLDDKSAEEVKKLLEGWTRGVDDLNVDERGEYFSADVFYRVFGQPQRKQFISSDYAYYLYYECKDGMVQIKVLAALLEENVVLVSDFNIF
jgi:hypothetical protein